jgi:hypothetical protein
MKSLLLILVLLVVVAFGLLQILPTDLHAEERTLCNTGPQCHDGMTQCGPGLTCKCFIGTCYKEESGG